MFKCFISVCQSHRLQCLFCRKYLLTRLLHVHVVLCIHAKSSSLSIILYCMPLFSRYLIFVDFDNLKIFVLLISGSLCTWISKNITHKIRNMKTNQLISPRKYCTSKIQCCSVITGNRYVKIHIPTCVPPKLLCPCID